MKKMELFDVETEFDPLELGELDEFEGDEDGAQSDYVVPVIPDAEKSIVPEEVELPAPERIERLLKGIPGQQFRILSAVSACASEPRKMDEIAAAVEAQYPSEGSVYSSARIVQLLEAAGAIERVGAAGEEAEEAPEAEEAIQEAGATAFESELVGEPNYVHVQRERPCSYVATEDGLAAVRERVSFERVRELVEEEPRYAPVYKRILEMCAAPGGRMIREINAVVDPDPLCQEPRRFSQFFLGRLEDVNAVRWDEMWMTTDFGRQALELGVLESAEACGDISAANEARKRELEKQAEFERQAAERAAFAAEKAAREAEEAAALAAQEAAAAETDDTGADATQATN